MTLYNKARNDQWEKADVCMSIIARYGTGGGNIPIVMVEVEDGMVHRQWASTRSEISGSSRSSELYARSAGDTA